MACGIEVNYLNQFLLSVAEFYRQPVNSEFEMLTEMAEFLERLLDDDLRVYRNDKKNLLLPAIHHLPQAVKLAGRNTRAVVDRINQLAPFVNWQQTRGYDVLGEHYCQNYGYCSIIGPNRLIEHSTLKLGFGLWGPGLHYPLHHHAAEECYHVLGSQIEFRRQSESWQTYEDGQAIYNKPNEIHELKSSHQAMFLLYTWRGDVGKDAVLNV